MKPLAILGPALVVVFAVAPSGAAVPPRPTPVPPCGNGLLDWDEECDDGNHDLGDDCPALAGGDCRYSTAGVLIPGDPRQRRVRELGCLLEWYVVNPDQPVGRSGLPDARQVCRDQDPRCDFNPQPGRCAFRVVACLNNEDVRLPDCRPAGVSGLRVLRPRPSTNPRRALRNENFEALAHAVDHLHDPGDPQSGHSIAPALPPRERNHCSAPFVVRVDRGRRRSAAERLAVEVWDWESQPRQRLRAQLDLRCRS